MAAEAAATRSLRVLYVFILVLNTTCAISQWGTGHVTDIRNIDDARSNLRPQKGSEQTDKSSPQQVGEAWAKQAKKSHVFSTKITRRNSYEEYRDFYTTIGLHGVDDSMARKNFLDAVKGESDSQVSDLDVLTEQVKEKPPDNIFIMKRLRAAIENGTLPVNERALQTFPEMVTYEVEMKKIEGNLLEIGSGYTASFLASSNPTITAANLLLHDSNTHGKENLHQNIPNFFLGSLDQDRLPAAVEYLYNDPQVLFNSILLSNLTSMVGDLLPHEYEELLARLLSLSRTTFIADIDTRDEHMLKFFKNWENLVALLEKCCTVAGLDCVAQQVKGFLGYWNSGALYRVDVVAGTRILPESFCEKFQTEQECYMQFGNRSAPTVIYFSGDSSVHVPEANSWIPLQLMNYIGPVLETRERLLYQLLHVPYKEDQGLCNLYINGSEIMSVQDLLRQIDDGISPIWDCKDSTLLHDQVKFLVDLDPSLTSTVADEKDSHLAREILPKTHDQKKPLGYRVAGLEQLYEQVDSVAQRWNRLNDDDAVEAGQKDQEQIQRLMKNWDREPYPPDPKQDSDLSRLDKTWRREEEDIGIDPPRIQHYVKSGQVKESLSSNLDPALTKDEKELRQAMGSLGGLKANRGDLPLIKTKGNGAQSPHIQSNIRYQALNMPRNIQNVRMPQQKPISLTSTPSAIGKVEGLHDKQLPLGDGRHQIPKPVPKKIQGNARKVYRNRNDLAGADTQDHGQQVPVQNDLGHLGPVGKLEAPEPSDRAQVDLIERRKDGMRRLLQEDPLKELSLDARKRLEKYKEEFKKNMLQRLEAQKVNKINGLGDSASRKATSPNHKKEEESVSTPISTSVKPFKYPSRIKKDENKQSTEKQKPGQGNDEPPKPSTEQEKIFNSNINKNEKMYHPPVGHTFGPRQKEEGIYDLEWKLIRNDIAAIGGTDKNFFSVFTYGGDQQVLLGAKIAHSYPKSTVLSVLDPNNIISLPGHRKMISSLGVRNFLLLVNNMSPGTVDTIIKMPEIFHIQILGMETFHNLVSLGEGFLFHLGHLLTMSHVTYLEVPSPKQLAVAYLLLSNSTTLEKNHAVFKGMIYEALKLHGLQNGAEVSLLDDVNIFGGLPTSIKLVKIKVGQIQRSVTFDCQNTNASIQLNPDGHCSIVISKKEGKLARCMEGIGLELLLALDLDQVARGALLKDYLKLPVYSDMCPTHIVWFNNTLVYHVADSTSGILQSSTDLIRLMTNQAAVSMLGNEIYSQPFSFMEYKSMEGEMIKLLAKHYKNSTFVSLHSNMEEAEKLYRETQRINLSNIVINSLTVDQELTTKLLQSPDFMRYQYFGLEAFLDSIIEMREDDFNLMIGQMIATGVTTFFQLPSAQMLSLAFATFFPESFTGQPIKGNTVLDEKSIYYKKYHPFPVFQNAELKMLGESAEAEVNINISAQVLQPPLMQSVSFPWKMVRVDVRNLTVLVNHHFDYQLDGHDRKYTLHCVAHSKSSYEVYLIREHDGYKIPYGDVHAISLIALLRMGLLEPMKDKFYDLFLSLPFYEDMAPWNIVFRSGRLEYIDYDTKDFTFNKMVPAAYQVMAMLMNYERTVHDFGHCEQHAQNQYNFPYIAHCVASDYDGPCKDSRYPVPCGDYTCKSTYIECLKSLSELEKKKAEWKQQMVANLKTPGFVYKDRLNLPYTSGQWSFGHNGAKNPQNGQFILRRPRQYFMNKFRRW